MKRLMKLCALAVAVAFAVPAVASELEFSGYGRAGVGLNVKGGGQVCFGLADADTKWRLGNECDYTIEPQFTSRFVKNDKENDKSAWGVVFMPGIYRTWAAPTPGTSGNVFTEIPASVRQFYFFGEKVPQLFKGTIWGGRRYYDRIHWGINDQFTEIEDGDGAGVEDMDIGLGKLSLAFMMNPNHESTGGNAAVRPYKVLARLTSVKTFEKGALQFWTGVYGTSSVDDVEGAGTRGKFAIYHTLDTERFGSNWVGVKTEFGKNIKLVRVLVKQTYAAKSIATDFDAIAQFRMRQTRPEGYDVPFTKSNWFSIGARSDTRISGPFRGLIEIGHDMVKAENVDAQHLTKLTACLAMSAGQDSGSRPTFRAFYTHAFWNEAAKGAGGVYNHWQSGPELAQVYGNSTNGGSFGLQAEAWW